MEERELENWCKIDWWDYLFPWEPLAGGKSNGDSRVEVGTGDMSDGVNHDHHNQTPHNWYPWQCYHLFIAQIHHHRRTTGEYQEISPQYLRDQLFDSTTSTIPSFLKIFINKKKDYIASLSFLSFDWCFVKYFFVFVFLIKNFTWLFSIFYILCYKKHKSTFQKTERKNTGKGGM